MCEGQTAPSKPAILVGAVGLSLEVGVQGAGIQKGSDPEPGNSPRFWAILEFQGSRLDCSGFSKVSKGSQR